MKKSKKAVIIVAAVLFTVLAVVVGMFGREGATLLGMKANTQKGIYEVNYSANYKLDELLAQGGVQTEDQLAQYIIKVMLKGLPINIPYEVPELACSTFIAQTPENGYILGRNLDNQQTDLAVVKTSPKGAYSSVSVVNLSFLGYTAELTPKSIANRIKVLAVPFFPLDGVNEKGLAVGVLQLQAPPTHQDTGKTDVGTTLAIRVLLDKASTVDEAVTLLEGFDMHASANGCYHLQIADATGKSVVVSYSDNKTIVTNKNGDFQCATNFYLHDVPFEYEKQGVDRYEKMVNVLTDKKGVLSAEDGMGLLEYVAITGTEPDQEGRVYSTQWSSIYDLANPSLTLCADRDYENAFTYPVK